MRTPVAFRRPSLIAALAFFQCAAATSGSRRVLSQSSYVAVCQEISAALADASAVYYPGTIGYVSDMFHPISSSSNAAACSIRPASAADVGAVLKIVGSTRTPFAVKGGGHTANPGYSSTTGVHISMSDFNDVDYDSSSSTAIIGAGLIWDDVYQALQPHGVNVVGGRVSGVGVAGFTLGGGYGWISNQHGLTLDTVVNFELVLPNGTVAEVNEASQPELFFGLKGGSNNFGIVTRFTMKTFSQGPVWGGPIIIDRLHWDPVIAGVADFSANNMDPKASLIATFDSPSLVVSLPLVTLLLFYDGSTPPAGTFDEFLSIPAISQEVSTRSFLSLVQSTPSNVTTGSRGVFNTVPTISYSVDFLQAVANETLFWGSILALDSATLVSYDVEPFMPSVLSFGSTSSSAYPPSRSQLYLPTCIYYSWQLPTADQFMHDTIVQSQQTLQAKAVAEGQDLSIASVYGNYAVAGTPLEEIYGGNLPRLEALKRAVDPTDVMGLAGGWKFA